MLLECVVCHNHFSQLAKIPCGYYIEKGNDKTVFIMPVDETSYRNICAVCLLSFKGSDND
jgi:hypothetical protein